MAEVLGREKAAVGTAAAMLVMGMAVAAKATWTEAAAVAETGSGMDATRNLRNRARMHTRRR